MKKLIVTYLCVCLSFLASADPWEELTLEEATIVLEQLRVNPFIFDHCDCCGTGEDAVFIKVSNVKIIPSPFDEKMYLIKFDATPLAAMTIKDNETTFSEYESDESYWSKFSVNYTRGYQTYSKKATNFFNIIPYHKEDLSSCQEDYAYPTPKELKKIVKAKGYKKWYKDRIVLMKNGYFETNDY